MLDFEELQKLESERDSARQLLKDSRGDAAMEELAQDELASLQEQHATLTERLPWLCCRGIPAMSAV